MRTQEHAEKSALLAFVMPTLAGALCVLLSVVLFGTQRHQSHLYWHVHAAAWSLVVLSLALVPRYLLDYAPMLLKWAFWFSLQGEIEVNWQRLERGAEPVVPYSQRLHQASISFMFLTSLSLHVGWFRRRPLVLLHGLLYAAQLCIIPKPRPPSLLYAVVQAGVFALVYLAGHVLLEVYALQRPAPTVTGRSLLVLSKLLYSGWTLWVASWQMLVLLGTLHLFGTVLGILYNEDDFWHFCQLETAAVTARSKEADIEEGDPRAKAD